MNQGLVKAPDFAFCTLNTHYWGVHGWKKMRNFAKNLQKGYEYGAVPAK